MYPTRNIGNTLAPGLVVTVFLLLLAGLTTTVQAAEGDRSGDGEASTTAHSRDLLLYPRGRMAVTVGGGWHRLRQVTHVDNGSDLFRRKNEAYIAQAQMDLWIVRNRMLLHVEGEGRNGKYRYNDSTLDDSKYEELDFSLDLRYLPFFDNFILGFGVEFDFFKEDQDHDSPLPAPIDQEILSAAVNLHLGFRTKYVALELIPSASYGHGDEADSIKSARGRFRFSVGTEFVWACLYGDLVYSHQEEPTDDDITIYNFTAYGSLMIHIAPLEWLEIAAGGFWQIRHGRTEKVHGVRQDEEGGGPVVNIIFAW